MENRRLSGVVVKAMISNLSARVQQQRFTRQFADMADELSKLLSGGIPIREAVSYLREQKPKNREAAVILQAVHDGIMTGVGVSDALQPWISPIAVAALHLGSESGHLAEILRSFAEQYRRQREWLGQLFKLLSYPTVLLVGNFAVQILMAWVIVPEFRAMYATSGIHLDESSAALMTGVQALPAIFIASILFLGIAVLVFIVQAHRQSKLWKRISVRLPGQRMIRALRTQQTCHLLRMLLEGGTPIIDALQVLSTNGASRWMRAGCKQAQRKLLSGVRLSEAFTADFDVLLRSTLSVAEQTGDVTAAFHQTDVYLQQYTHRRIEFALKWVEPVMLLVLGVFVAVTMLALFVPMYEMISSVSAGTS